MARREAVRLFASLRSVGLRLQPPSVAWASSQPQLATPFRLLQLRSYALPPHTLMTMPSLSPTMTHGNIASWKVKEGDMVAPGQILAEVETDKATIEWEGQEDGFIAKILHGTGASNIALGEPVAILVEDAESVPAFKDYTPGSAPAPSAPAPKAPAAAPKAVTVPAVPTNSWPPHTVMGMPALSPTMTQGNIVSWNKKVGDHVAAGDIFCEVETDKASIGWDSQEDCYLAQILLPDGSQDIALGTPAFVIVEDKAHVDAFKSFTAADATPGAKPAAVAPEAAPAASEAAPAAAQHATPAAVQQAPATPGGRVIASPYARKLAAQGGLGLEGLSGSGPGGRIVAADVQQAIASGKVSPAAASAPAAAATPAAAASKSAVIESGLSYVDIPHSQIRRITAQRLLESKQTIPHYYLTVEVQVDEMLKLREQINASFSKDAGVKISVNDFVIKAAALALKKVPGVNASWQKDFIRQYDNVDISVAMQTPTGLMTPIVKDAHTKGLSGISGNVKALAAKAKEGKLAPAEFMGGTFTISNLGMFGVKHFAAIVNPPQAAILAVGAANKKVVMSKSGDFSEVSVITITLSCDHRVIDGAMGAQWLQAFKGYVETPYTMML